MVRRLLTVSDRVEIATGLKAGWSLRRIAEHVDRDVSVVSREVARNSTKTRGYLLVHAQCAAERRRCRPQERKVARDLVLRARVMADLGRSRTPNQIAGRLRREAGDPTLGCVSNSPNAQGRTVSHEAIYQFIYAMPRGDLAKHGIFLQSKRTTRRPVAKGRRPGPIVGMVSIDDRPGEVAQRRVPGHWEGDLIIGKNSKTAAVTLVERTTLFTTILGLPRDRTSPEVTQAIITHANSLPAMMRGSITWDQGVEMAAHAALTLATNMPVYFAHPRSPWERGLNENTNRLIREYLPKGDTITGHQPYLNAIAEELNERPRRSLGYLTPREAFTRLLNTSNVATTP
jgi:IS30 family transposase